MAVGTKEEQERLSDERLKYVPVSMQEQWRNRVRQRPAGVQDTVSA